MAPPEPVEAALDSALRRGLTSISRLRWVLERCGGKERTGAGVPRELVRQRSPGEVPVESVLEARVVKLLRAAGLPRRFVSTSSATGAASWRAWDLAYPEARLAIEVDGYRWHSGRAEWQRDLARRNELTSRGGRVLHATTPCLREEPQRLVVEVRRGLPSLTRRGE